MGKLSYLYTDSEGAEDTSSSVESVKRKKKSSILKFGNGNIKKKKCKVHSKSEPDDSNRSRSNSSQRMTMQKLKGILKHTEPESSDEDDDSEPNYVYRSQDRCFVGRVPLPAGAKPGRGGGLALIVKKHGSVVPPSTTTDKPSTTSTKRRLMKRLSRKRSY